MLTAVVFDFGEVLVETGPAFLYRKIFPTDEDMRFFLEKILTQPLRSSWHAGACVGDEVRRLAARHPEYAEAILAFHSRFIETVRGPIEGMPELVHEMKAQGMRLYGLTNWAKDTFSIVPATFPFLRLLDDVIVSGMVGVKKPDPAIFDLAIRRFQLDPATSLFTDDKQTNVDAAARAGFRAVRFENAAQLRAAIGQHGAD